MNLLIVDDIATNRKLLRVTLEPEGHNTLEAADGVEALQILGREKAEAVISGVLMPAMDGYRLGYEIRRHQDWKTISFMFYTATCTSPSDERQGLIWARTPSSANRLPPGPASKS
jgi:Response regulator containing CheY-like receiver, AAA-type ATPase, and DNA-binding domains